MNSTYFGLFAELGEANIPLVRNGTDPSPPFTNAG